jgi:hypothetical protein
MQHWLGLDVVCHVMFTTLLGNANDIMFMSKLQQNCNYCPKHNQVSSYNLHTPVLCELFGNNVA